MGRRKRCCDQTPPASVHRPSRKPALYVDGRAASLPRTSRRSRRSNANKIGLLTFFLEHEVSASLAYAMVEVCYHTHTRKLSFVRVGGHNSHNFSTGGKLQRGPSCGCLVYSFVDQVHLQSVVVIRQRCTGPVKYHDRSINEAMKQLNHYPEFEVLFHLSILQPFLHLNSWFKIWHMGYSTLL